MKKTFTLLLILALSILVIGGCDSTTQNTQTNPTVVCNKPYIQVGSSCCLDQNSNNVCDKDETQQKTEQTQTPVQQVKTLSTDEMKTIVYQAIRKYIPQSTVGGFNGHDYFSATVCGDQWSYPDKQADVSKNVISAAVWACQDATYTPEYMLSINTNPSPSEDYIKSLTNGKVLIHDKQYRNVQGLRNRDEYSMEFNCQKFWITIFTQDFVGGDSYSTYPAYHNYNIDKVAMENMANEILSQCQ